jgi:hypothetical protein
MVDVLFAPLESLLRMGFDPSKPKLHPDVQDDREGRRRDGEVAPTIVRLCRSFPSGSSWHEGSRLPTVTMKLLGANDRSRDLDSQPRRAPADPSQPVILVEAVVTPGAPGFQGAARTVDCPLWTARTTSVGKPASAM